VKDILTGKCRSKAYHKEYRLGSNPITIGCSMGIKEFLVESFGDSG